MAKHSKGKHAVGSAKAEAPAQTEAEAAESAGAAPAGVAAGDAPASGDASADEVGGTSEAADAPADAPVPDAAAEEAPSGGVGAFEAPQKPAEAEAPDAHGRLRTALIAAGSTAAALAIIYLIGVGIFATHAMPSTTIAGMDFSLMAPDDIKEKLDGTLDDHAFSVVGKRMNFEVTAEEAGIGCDTAQVAAGVMASQDAWSWPIEAFQSHDRTYMFTDLLHADDLEAVVSSQLEAVNADSVQPVNATVAFSEEEGRFVGVKEVKGTAIDPEVLYETILAGILRLDDKIVLTDEVLVQPTILIDDARIPAAVDKANGYTKAEFDVTMGDALVAHVEPALTAQWVSVSPELEVAFDEGALNAWADGVASGCNTVGSTRTYTRPDGKQVTVSGGTYGWWIDNDALVAQVVEAVKSGSDQALAAPVVQSGTGFTGLGGQDWGPRYIDIDLSEQYARFYDNGQIIWESPIVSGNPNKGDATPTGVYSANQKLRNTVLRGPIKEDDKPEWESPVQYWMPFIGNSIGLHDAYWQAAFGGSRYLSHGSHGCINLPDGAASSLYGMFSAGDVVVVHR